MTVPLKAWSSQELLSQKNKEYLRDDVDITKDNIGELEGEIAMLKDFRNGRLDHRTFTSDNIDTKMKTMFPHIKSDKLQEVKREILKRTRP